MDAGILIMRMMHLALSRLMQFQALSSNTESSNGAWNFGFVHIYSVRLFFFALVLLHVFVDTEEHCLQSQTVVYLIESAGRICLRLDSLR